MEKLEAVNLQYFYTYNNWIIALLLLAYVSAYSNLLIDYNGFVALSGKFHGGTSPIQRIRFVFGGKQLRGNLHSHNGHQFARKELNAS